NVSFPLEGKCRGAAKGCTTLQDGLTRYGYVTAKRRPFPPTGIYYSLTQKRRVPRFFASLRMTSESGRKSRNAAYKTHRPKGDTFPFEPSEPFEPFEPFL
ncbi:hypothetical protein, partial [uncultured Dialister sp.]|uniref:hypothetical protein n=1 Tax=uncultured Dialister sp. TaxID=278064 RepID=UPI0025EDEAA1